MSFMALLNMFSFSSIFLDIWNTFFCFSVFYFYYLSFYACFEWFIFFSFWIIFSYFCVWLYFWLDVRHSDLGIFLYSCEYSSEETSILAKNYINKRKPTVLAISMKGGVLRRAIKTALNSLHLDASGFVLMYISWGLKWSLWLAFTC